MGISYSNNIGLIVKFKSFFRWEKILCLCFIKTIYIIFWMKKHYVIVTRQKSKADADFLSTKESFIKKFRKMINMLRIFIRFQGELYVHR